MVRSMGFASSLKVDLMKIPGKSSKWVVQGFDPYYICFRLSDGQKFSIIAFDVYVTLGVPIKGWQIIKFNKPFIDKEYDEVHTA